jgi:hypothetical protein
MNVETRRPWFDRLVALALFGISLAVYNATLTPSLSYVSPDGNELATVPYVLGLAHATGYPLYTWLGKLFTFLPFGDVAHRMNLMSAILGAGGVTLLYGIMRLITGRWLPSAFTALLFAFSLTFWSQTGIAEVYAPNLFMVALTVYLLLKWERAEQVDKETSREGNKYKGRQGSLSPCLLVSLFTFILVYALSFGTHLSNLGFAPAFALFILLVNWRTLVSPLKLGGGWLAFVLGCAQFLWLPYKASTLNDALMRRDAPATLEGIYRYTLGAFPNFKFAFPLWALPDRVVIYLDLLRQNFGLAGVLLGLYGMAEMLFRDTKKFFLFITMYLTHVVFFVQYRAFDLDVFFIPAHFVYAIFIGYGIYRLIEYICLLVRNRGMWRRAVSVALALLLLPLAGEVRANYERNDYSQDTAINDFYENVFQMLPEGSALLGRGGVFGYDMFYFRLAYNVRPDVIMPLLDDPKPSRQELEGREIYTTVRANSGQQGRNPWSIPPGLVGPEAWQIPLLVGQSGATSSRRGGELILYQISQEPPHLVMEQAEPQQRIEQDLNGLELVGYDLDKSEVERGGRIRLTLYWRGHRSQHTFIATTLGDPLEVHELGFGNLQRYVETFHPDPDASVVEDYTLVVPSSLSPGAQILRVGLVELPGPGRGEMVVKGSVELGEIKVH